MTKDDLQSRILTRIVENFLATGKGTSRRRLIIEFPDSALPGLIAEFTRDGVLRTAVAGSNEEYLPSIAAFDLEGNEEFLRTARKSFILVGGILKAFYFEDTEPAAIAIPELLERARKLEPDATERTIQLGLYLLRDGNLSGGHSTSGDGKVTSIHASERLALVSDLEKEWGDQLRRLLPKDRDAEARPADMSDKQTREQGTEIGDLATWEKIRVLGTGGQSDVWLVRNPVRQAEISRSIRDILDFQSNRGTVGFQDQGEHTKLFATAMKALVRDELSSDLGALKQFKIPDRESDLAIARLRREIHVLSKPRPGLLKLLDSNEQEHWIVTEYFSQGSLERQIAVFQGKSVMALRAFRSLVLTVNSLHKDQIVHRDIKPANVFVRSNEEIILGDFGIVYIPDEGERLTMTNEKVGPRDYMPPWAPIAARQESVEPDFDVYMLGKLLWCMVAGRLKLFREYHHRVDCNLEQIFPKDSNMRLINRILDRCITEDHRHCFTDAGKLLQAVDETLELMEGGVQPLDLPRPCRVCGKGFYKSQGYTGSAAILVSRYDEHNSHAGSVRLVPFVCEFCNHFEFFAPGYPGEAAKRK